MSSVWRTKMMNVLLRRGVIAMVVLSFLLLHGPNDVLSKTGKTAPKPKSSPGAKAAQAAPGPQSGQASQAAEGGLHSAAKAAVLMDALTGQILYEQNPQLKLGPASFVKILTLYLVFDALRAGQLKMDDMVTVSERAWRIQGSKMFIKVGDRVKVEDLLKGIAVSSGNDACIAIAEHIAGTEDVFVSKMNEKALSLGLKESRFVNSHGMPAEGQMTTAMDMAILAKRYMADHPEAMPLHSTAEFEYNKIKQGNRNTLLNKGGVDGLKTGHIEESGYHLLATAKRDNQRMIAVVMGCDKMSTRAREALKLLEHGFRNFSTVEAVTKGSSFGPVKVKRGKENTVMLVAADTVRVTVPKGKEKSVSAVPELPPSVVAPIQKGQSLAKIVVQNEGKVVGEAGLLSASEIKKSLIPPWPVLVGIIAGLVLLGFAGLWWSRRTKQKKYS
jgi:D-alanyl-D-alanine carboxypeptidase (penicillin-binding protein 5/6)